MLWKLFEMLRKELTLSSVRLYFDFVSDIHDSVIGIRNGHIHFVLRKRKLLQEIMGPHTRNFWRTDWRRFFWAQLIPPSFGCSLNVDISKAFPNSNIMRVGKGRSFCCLVLNPQCRRYCRHLFISSLAWEKYIILSVMWDVRDDEWWESAKKTMRNSVVYTYTYTYT